jgi:hypothetical protein
MNEGFMRRFARVHYGSTTEEREIDSKGRMFLAHIGNIPSIQHKLVKRVKDAEDVKKIFKLITLEPVDSVEFIERE